jgi:hypothetical protein
MPLMIAKNPRVACYLASAEIYCPNEKVSALLLLFLDPAYAYTADM